MISNRLIIKIFFLNISLVILLALCEILIDIETQDIREEFLKFSILELFFLGVIFAPIVEEFAFRYPLIKENNWVYISLLHGIIFTFLNNRTDTIVLAGVVTVSLLNFVGYFFEKRKQAHFLISLLYAILFALCHLSNYNTSMLYEKKTIVIIFQFLPQITTGLVLTYLRMKKVKYFKIVLYHMLYNLFFLTLDSLYNLFF